MFVARILPFSLFCLLALTAFVVADEPAKPTWRYAPELLRPFWQGEVTEGEVGILIDTKRSVKVKDF